MIVVSPIFKSDWCDTLVNKYEIYCIPCFLNNHENADKTSMRNYKTNNYKL